MATTAQLRESVIYRNRRCSRAQYIIFKGFERSHRGAPVILRQGRRTLGEQYYFYTHQPPLAAYPRPSAPHIKHNLGHHADDLGNPQAVAVYFRALGIACSFNVPGESWHLDPLYEMQVLHAAQMLLRKATPARYPTLNQGKTGDAVTRLQKLLRSLNVSGAPKPTGYFGILTKKAVQRFQRKHDLPDDGVVGPKTWAKLRAASD